MGGCCSVEENDEPISNKPLETAEYMCGYRGMKVQEWTDQYMRYYDDIVSYISDRIYRETEKGKYHVTFEFYGTNAQRRWDMGKLTFDHRKKRLICPMPSVNWKIGTLSIVQEHLYILLANKGYKVVITESRDKLSDYLYVEWQDSNIELLESTTA